MIAKLTSENNNLMAQMENMANLAIEDKTRFKDAKLSRINAMRKMRDESQTQARQLESVKAQLYLEKRVRHGLDKEVSALKRDKEKANAILEDLKRDVAFSARNEPEVVRASIMQRLEEVHGLLKGEDA